jgi:adenine-specific DNA-methyltransferase
MGRIKVVSRELGWKGGGGFRFMRLGPSLYLRDAELGMTALNPAYQNGALIDAVCVELGYERLQDGVFHGRRSAELLHVSEDFVSQHYLDTLAGLVPTDLRLRVLAARYAGDATLPEAVRLERIPDALLDRFSLPRSDDATVAASFG